MINELRIGNWVRIDDMPPEQITLEIFAMLKGYPFHISKFQPITLSPEILEKCGFESKDLGVITNYFMRGGTFWFSILFDKEHKQFMFDSPHYNLIYKYIHQLQNLYFALTGTELEINLTEKA